MHKKEETCFWVAVEMALSLGLPMFIAASGVSVDFERRAIERLISVDQLVTVTVSGDSVEVSGDLVNGVFGEVA